MQYFLTGAQNLKVAFILDLNKIYYGFWEFIGKNGIFFFHIQVKYVQTMSSLQDQVATVLF